MLLVTPGERGKEKERASLGDEGEEFFQLLTQHGQSGCPLGAKVRLSKRPGVT